jgi:hypothetical protein
MTNHKMVAILEQFQLTEKRLQRFTNKVHLPAEGWQQQQLLFMQFFIFHTRWNVKKHDGAVKLFSKASNVPTR